LFLVIADPAQNIKGLVDFLIQNEKNQGFLSFSLLLHISDKVALHGFDQRTYDLKDPLFPLAASSLGFRLKGPLGGGEM
jgi:hypothetical protein